jgi:O-antigen ligase
VASFTVFAFLAVNFIPTLKDRIGYLRWTYMMYEQGKISGDYSDMGRAISYDVAYKVLKQNSLIGVGAGDILDEMKKGYDQWYPQVKDEQRLVPHNQFLTVGVAAGVPVMCLFALWVIYPLFNIKRGKRGFFFVVIWLGVLSSLFIEPMLEVQFGVYVFLFFLLWQRHNMLFPPIASEEQADIILH